MTAQSPVGTGEVATAELMGAVNLLTTYAADALRATLEQNKSDITGVTNAELRRDFTRAEHTLRASLQHSPVSPIQETEDKRDAERWRAMRRASVVGNDGETALRFSVWVNRRDMIFPPVQEGWSGMADAIADTLIRADAVTIEPDPQDNNG